MNDRITCFKAYDARGKVPDELNAGIAYRVGRAYAEFVRPRRVAVGRDVRQSSEELFAALTDGLRDSGVDVLDLGLCGTEQVYFAAFHLELDGGIMITASHNPVDYNGLKFVRECAKPLSGDSGLDDIRRIAEKNAFRDPKRRGIMIPTDLNRDYIEHLLGYLGHLDRLKPLKIISNPGNGMAGPVIDLLEQRLPFEFVKIQHQPDGTFPNGIPNPLLPEGRGATIDAIRQHHADLGVAWDGDFDRCFLFDHNGRFIEGYYIVGLLGAQLLQQNPGERIVHDPRLTWNTIELVAQNGGEAVQSKAGHAFIKETMRAVNGIYGGEMSAHHYFRDFGYCDSGMIPWLLLAEMISTQNKTLAELVDERIERYPVSGEINVEVKDPRAVLEKVQVHFADLPHQIDRIDGLGMDFGDWRFNLRASNTEPLLRMNVESRGDQALMERRRDEILDLIS
ncbi:MAG: phosphomannomutase [Gammaproteobacteria bacterium]|nr:phosphomannomutase [Gammaproteobacteria bacterium]MDH3536270.1 phosphomannomutase [Gammaproteobacteria bacterium]